MRDSATLATKSVVTSVPAASAHARVTAIDVMRGAVMVLMALDHVREFLTDVPGNPLDPRQTTVELYVTRWITHLCAPVFVALAGTSIFFQQQRKTSGDLTRRLVARGLWLIVAELTLVHLAFTFNWTWSVQFLEVIWAIGASMMLMALIIHVGVRWSAIVGAALIAGHNAFDGVTVTDSGALVWLWRLLHVPGPLTGPPLEPPIIIVAYPLLPWAGVMAVGYAFGRMMLLAPEERMRLQRRTGAAMLAAFVACGRPMSTAIRFRGCHKRDGGARCCHF